ncbi:N-acetylmuramoyl-L-alanine amidase family protein [Psychroserpens damuponensis]|uniref:N-acetylmuramoyl-L-alanine amidase family protein n=1 Tax=Psychroserpens damuponensis TaxID=943936 RepID=UPI000590F68E|nr:N-acetylmuramoyl-L-alanine amidase [Psychroserpens damuponensis]
MKTTSRNILVLVGFLFTSILTTAHGFQKDKDKFVVVLDAGHGGHDSGNTGNGHKESDIALKITLQVGKELEKNKDIKVIYTRTKDVFVTLRGRAKIANDADADLFVSVHCNAHSSQASGTETFVLGVANTKRNMEIAKKENEVIFLESDYEKHYEGFDPDSPESLIVLGLLSEEYTENSIKLARMVEDNFEKGLKRKSRGLKQASLWVLHNTYMPSVLIEVGFLTNNAEGKFLNTKSGQTKMASGIKKAIMGYKSYVEQNVGENIYQGTEIETVEITGESQIIENVVFKVQIAASSREIAPKSYNFKGLSDISREKVGKVYKYYYGYTSDYNAIKQMQQKAVAKGYKDCFVVAYKDGNKIDVSEAISTATN